MPWVWVWAEVWLGWMVMSEVEEVVGLSNAFLGGCTLLGDTRGHLGWLK